jgi:NADPH-dependent 7-cyano-7-deazaguanine reductase QueF
MQSEALNNTHWRYKMTLLTQPNEHPEIKLYEQHIVKLPACCPVSGNPQAGSTITISYTPAACFLEVYSLQKFVNSFVGGREGVRDMEGMVQVIAHETAKALGVTVKVRADLNLQNEQRMVLRVRAEVA